MTEYNIPAWRDTYFTTGASPYEYYIVADGTDVFHGKVWKSPNEAETKVNVTKIIRDWLANQLPDFRNIADVVEKHERAYRTFDLCEVGGDVVARYNVLFDYDGEWNGEYKVLTEPIDGHLDPRMKILWSIYSPTDIDIDMKITYWRLITSAVTIPFEGGDTRILWDTNLLPWSSWVVEIPDLDNFTYRNVGEDGVTVWVPAINTLADHTYNIYYVYSGETLGYTVATQKGATFSFSPDPAIIGSHSGDSVNVTWTTQVTGATYTYEVNGNFFEISNYSGNRMTLTAKANNDTFSANTGWLKVYVNGELGGTLTVQQEGKYFIINTPSMTFDIDGETKNASWSTDIDLAVISVTVSNIAFTISNVTLSGCSITASDNSSGTEEVEGTVSIYSGSTLLGTINLLQDASYTNRRLTLKVISGGTIQWGWGRYTSGGDYRFKRNGIWSEWHFQLPPNPTDIFTFSAQTNDIIEFRGMGVADSNYNDYSPILFRYGGTMYRAFYEVYGNPLSLFYYNDFSGQTVVPTNIYGNLSGLFKAQPVVSAKNLCLPSDFNGRDKYCRQMFLNCEFLIDPPEVLPATVVTSKCYESMFSLCPSLTKTPKLLATSYGEESCSTMFKDCTLLSEVVCMANDVADYYVFYHWLEGVAANGTFKRNPDHIYNWPSGSSGIPTGWTVVDYTP